MKLPQLLHSKPLVSLEIKIQVPVRGMPGAPVHRGSVIKKYEDVAQYQVLSMWCWNAVGASITQFHLDGGASRQLVQCENASRFLPGDGQCCSIRVPGYPGRVVPYMKQGSPIAYDAGNVKCNQGGWPENVTHDSGRLVSQWAWYAAGGPTDAEVNEVIDSISKGSPVVMYIAWDEGGGAHVQTLYGTHVSGGKRFFNVADPWDGTSIDRVDQLCPGGKWGGSMFTDAILPAGSFG